MITSYITYVFVKLGASAFTALVDVAFFVGEDGGEGDGEARRVSISLSNISEILDLNDLLAVALEVARSSRNVIAWVTPGRFTSPGSYELTAVRFPVVGTSVV